jgi:hypothetical protein
LHAGDQQCHGPSLPRRCQRPLIVHAAVCVVTCFGLTFTHFVVFVRRI